MVVAHGCNANSENAEADELHVQGQSGYWDTVSKTVFEMFY